jgi:hypothetical protein
VCDRYQWDTTFRERTAVVVQTATWTLPAAQVVRPQETFSYIACLNDEQARRATTVSTAFRWTNVACQ